MKILLQRMDRPRWTASRFAGGFVFSFERTQVYFWWRSPQSSGRDA